MTDKDLLICLRIKGFAKPDIVSRCLDLPEDICVQKLATLIADSLLAETKIGYKLTPAGQVAADRASQEERESISADSIDKHYEIFCELNSPFKLLMSDWQMRSVNGELVPNDHSDSQYDQNILEKLYNIDVEAQKFLKTLSESVPRFEQYGRRFKTALVAINKGEHRYFAAPIIDSYHTIWFELHEDLIRLSGRTRADEAKAGRAV